jgi:hypothetical protein
MTSDSSVQCPPAGAGKRPVECGADPWTAPRVWTSSCASTGVVFEPQHGASILANMPATEGRPLL